MSQHAAGAMSPVLGPAGMVSDVFMFASLNSAPYVCHRSHIGLTASIKADATKSPAPLSGLHSSTRVRLCA